MSVSRRDLLRTGVFASAALALPLQRVVRAKSALDGRMATSKLPKPFTVPFVPPPNAVPVRTDATTDYYRITMSQVNGQVLPGVQTPLFAYNGTVPGPTIKVRRGREVVVRYTNQLPSQHPTLAYQPWTSVHLHGSASLPQYDGYASDVTNPGQYKDYRYPNVQDARTLWYHDHGYHHTAENVYQGLVAQYHLEDDLELALGLPHGEFDVPLVIGDVMFNKNGSLLFSLDDNSGMWGDVVLVNGRPWPAMTVKQRKYRFRVLNACVSRSFNWSLSTGDPLSVIATDGGLMPNVQTTNGIRHGSGERYDVIIDFSKYSPGTRIVMRNASPKNNINYQNTDKIMAFDVVADAFDPAFNEAPAVLNPANSTMLLQPSQAVRSRYFRLQRTGDKWTINGHTWDTVIDSGFQHVEASQRDGDIEIWELENKSGGWFHPTHVHLVDFKILDRNRKPPFAYELGAKDVVYVGENEKVRLLMRFEGRGKYMMHCHNLIHEDHDMMTQFEVVDPDQPGDDPLSDPCDDLPEVDDL
jgi:spore coat protein A, manganese oxidase